MKKLISLLLVVIFICSALVGCDWSGIFNQSENADDMTSTTTTTTSITTTKPKPQIVPTFEYGDNLTNEDLYFIKYEAQDLGLGYWVPAYEDFSGFLEYMRNKTYYEYSVDFSSAYYICAYLSNDFFETWPFPFAPFSVDDGYEVDYFIWHKFKYGETVPKEIGNSYFVGGYILFECTIERDILNNKECNYTYKYFAPLQNGYEDIGVDITSKYSGLNNYILRYSKNFYNVDYIFLTSTSYQKYYRTDGFTWTIEYNGDMYLMVDSSSDAYDSETFSFEKHRKEIGSRYDEVIPYLTVIEKNNGDQGYYIAISIESLVELIDK